MLTFVVSLDKRISEQMIFFLNDNIRFVSIVIPLGNRPCRPDQVRCPNSYKCISNTARCNGINDCGDNSDENSTQCPICNNATQFRCNNGQCIMRSLQW